MIAPARYTPSACLKFNCVPYKAELASCLTMPGWALTQRLAFAGTRSGSHVLLIQV